jgi:hypothetical protein
MRRCVPEMAFDPGPEAGSTLGEVGHPLQGEGANDASRSLEVVFEAVKDVEALSRGQGKAWQKQRQMPLDLLLGGATQPGEKLAAVGLEGGREAAAELLEDICGPHRDDGIA